MVAGSKIPVEQVFRALSDRTRLRILRLLRGGELCVCDIVRILRLPQPKISRHLAYLRKARLVTARKQGFWMHYQITPPASEFHASLMHCLGSCTGCDPELARDDRTLDRTRSVGGAPDGCCS